MFLRRGVACRVRCGSYKALNSPQSAFSFPHLEGKVLPKCQLS